MWKASGSYPLPYGMASTVTTINQSFGANWLKPQAIVNARYLRFGGQLDF